MGKMPGSVNDALIKRFKELSRKFKYTLTWDRGIELAKHVEFTAITGVPVYYCDPQSSWQKGTNKDTNSLVRQYFPKKTCLAQHTQEALDKVTAQLNSRPRKTLSFRTPKQLIEKSVVLTS